MTEENTQSNNNTFGLEQKCNEYLHNWKRAEADFVNYKKGEAERMGELVNYAKEDLILNILPILDSIYLSEKSFNSVQDKHSNILENVGMLEWIKGFEQIKKQIEGFLKKEGIEEIKTMGQKFNPETMEIVEEIEGGESGVVAEEVQKGYIMNGRVIRPAKVKIVK